MSVAGARVAVIGAGMAGSACARFLADAGFEARLFDKSRGVGGRMSTRRAEWTAGGGAEQRVRSDHGAPGFSAHAPAFVRFFEQAGRDGVLSRWLPRMAPGSYAPLDDPALWVPPLDMPPLCRALLVGLPVHTGCAVDALRHSPAGWSLESAGSTVGEGLDAALVAIPPQQASAHLRPHQAEWARPPAADVAPCRPAHRGLARLAGAQDGVRDDRGGRTLRRSALRRTDLAAARSSRVALFAAGPARMPGR